ncbi:MAG: hypothetical protein DLM50_07410 [Candidatus Meridianibacter frigidus]|nr:MAG: hypothetical protein DLM50_07410 [Candidatus Eremiobacteraeota bacterium]
MHVLAAAVLIGAGHQGRPQSCKFFPSHKCNLGAAGERELTPLVADEAAKILRAQGVSLVRVPADFSQHYRVQEAVFLHFDGAQPPCSSRASIGYARQQDEAAARNWRQLYGGYWPFGFHRDNFTANLSGYYGFRQVQASDAALVIEFGELSCLPQRAWLHANIKKLGELVAQFLQARLDRSKAPAGEFKRRYP